MYNLLSNIFHSFYLLMDAHNFNDVILLQFARPYLGKPVKLCAQMSK